MFSFDCTLRAADVVSPRVVGNPGPSLRIRRERPEAVRDRAESGQAFRKYRTSFLNFFRNQGAPPS